MSQYESKNNTNYFSYRKPSALAVLTRIGADQQINLMSTVGFLSRSGLAIFAGPV